MKAQILEHFWWPGLSKSVAYHCKTCQTLKKPDVVVNMNREDKKHNNHERCDYFRDRIKTNAIKATAYIDAAKKNMVTPINSKLLWEVITIRSIK